MVPRVGSPVGTRLRRVRHTPDARPSRTGDYVALPSFREIVALGEPAVPLLAQQMARDEGLDFMLAYAVLEIRGWDRREFVGGSEQDLRDQVLARLRDE